MTIVEGSDRILPALSPDAAHSADAYLKDTGVYVFTGAMADGVTQKLVKIIKADGSTEKISCGTIISAIGESPTELVPKLIEKLGDVHQGIR